MYTRAQKESSSVSPTSIHKKSNGSDGSRSFSVQRQQEINSSQEKEIPSYSRNAADSLAANVMRSMEEAKDSDEMSLKAGVQTQLTVGAVGDKYEQEADRVAAQVMRMSVAPDHSPQVQRFGEEDNPVQRWSLAQSITPVVQRQVDEQVQMRELVQRAFQAGGNEASGDLESRLNASKGGGSALAPEVRAFMEPRFGADFSSVRVHTGGEAVQMNRELGAQAFAHGSDVYFGAGKSPGNNELTAHELTHVVQQTGAVQRNLEVGKKDTPQEKGVQPQIQSLSNPSASLIQRDIKGKADVPLGEFEIDMKKKENPGGNSGEDGVVKFKPDKNKGRNTNDIRLSQIVKTLDLGTSKDFDWSTVPGEGNRNKMMTTDTDKVHITKQGDTLKSLARNYYGDPKRHADIYNDPENKKVLKSADPDTTIPKGTTLKIPKAVEGGYFIDHLAGDPKATPRTKKTDANVPQDYVWPGEELPGKNEHGFKKSKSIKAASLKDFPGTSGNWHFTFETVARSVDLGIYYGTIHWDFEVKNDTVSKEIFHVTPGVSDTFESALDEFNKFYKNQHTVMKGETLNSISQKYYGTPDKWDDIYKANKKKIKDPNHIEPGWQLNIPGVSGGV